MPRLPVNGSDASVWGELLNEYLLVAHNPDGTVKNGAITQGSLGLGAVDNTADADKPVSTATQAALDLKASTSALNLKADTSAVVQLAGTQTVTGAKNFTGGLQASGVAVADISSAQQLSNKRIIKRTVALTDAATITPNCDTTDIATVTLGGARTFAVPSGTPAAGQQLVIRLRQDATGGRTVTWAAGYRFSTDIPAPLLTATASKTDYVGFVYNATDTTWDCLAVTKGF
jgi:hypothetical protein